MSQATADEPTITEEQPSDQPRADCVAPTQAQPIAESPTLEPVTDNALDDGVPRDDDATDAPLDEGPETPSATEGDATNVTSSVPPSARSTTAADDRCAIAHQPYDFDHCTVQIALQLLPDDGNANGRMVVVGVRSHLDAPILRLVRWNGLGALPPLVGSLLDELKTELSKREQAAREALEKKKAEQTQRQSIVAASKTAYGKKTKASLATASAASSNGTMTDNRPRPEVQMTTAPQQQQGLF